MLALIFSIYKVYCYSYVILSCANTINECDAYYKKKLEEAD